MSMRGVAATARWAAAARARESRRPDRLFDDPYAAALAGAEGVELMAAMETVSLPDNPYLPIRTRFMDDGIRAHVRSAEMPVQVVVLGAGLDARPYRLAWPAGSTVFELDQRGVLEAKASAMRTLRAEPQCRVRPVAVDLRADWEADLIDAGLTAARPVLWVVEGVLVYLSDNEVECLLARAAALSSPGSRLLSDGLGAAFYQQSWARDQLRLLDAIGSPWRSAMRDPVTEFAHHGWQARVTQPGDVSAAASRWPFPSAGAAHSSPAQPLLIHACR